MSKLVIPANPGFFVYQGPNGRHGTFRPHGKWKAINADLLPNPPTWVGGKDTWAARIFVGFNVGGKPKWKLDHLVKVVRAARPDKPDSSYVMQKGIYQHKRTGKVVEEDGAQVIVVDVWGTPAKEFEREMVALAETIARELKQEEVILEIQKNGLSQRVMGIEP